MLELTTLLLFLVLILAVFGTLAYGALSAAPWVPLPRRDIERLLQLVKPAPGQVVYDLGCGDGRLLTAAAERYGATAVGYELAIVPFLAATLRRWLSPARAMVRVRFGSFWQKPLGQADAVVCFLTPYAMRKLAPKIANELKPGARFASYAFRLPGREPTLVSRPQPTSTPIYLYT